MNVAALRHPAGGSRAIRAIRSRMARAVCHLALLAGFLSTPVPGVGEVSASGEWQVGYALLGPDTRKDLKEQAEALTAALVREGLPARLYGRADAKSWIHVPADVPQNRWLMLAMAGCGQHTEFLVFRASREGRSVQLVARQPAAADAPTRRSASSSTGPDQDALSAVRNLATLAGQELSGAKERATSDVAVGVEFPEDPKGDWAGALQALAFASVSRSGWCPTSEDRPMRLTIRAARDVESYALDVRSSGPSGNHSFHGAHVPAPGLFDALCVAVESVTRWNGAVAGVRAVYPPPDMLLGLSGSKLFFVSGGRLGALDLTQDSPSWVTPANPALPPRFVCRRNDDGGLAIHQYAPQLARIPLSGGTPVPLAGHASSHPWGFDGTRDGTRLAVADGTRLRLYEGQQLLAEHRFPTALDCGPLLLKDQVVVGEENGDLHSVAWTKEVTRRWSVSTEERLRGRMHRGRGASDLALAASLDGILLAFATQDGRVVWRVDLGDRMVGDPIWLDDGIAVASGSGGITVRNPESGAILRQWQGTATVRHFTAIGGSARILATCDLEGTLFFLSASALRPIGTVPTRRSIGGLVPATQVTFSFADDEEIAGHSEDLVVAADSSGMILFIRVPEYPAASEGTPP